MYKILTFFVYTDSDGSGCCTSDSPCVVMSLMRTSGGSLN